MDAKDENPKYEAVAFDSQYNDENQNQRYTRLLEEFDDKFAKIRWDLPRTVPHENKEALLPPINKYIKELYKLLKTFLEIFSRNLQLVLDV